VIWRVLRERDLLDTRALLSGALKDKATLKVQLTIPNGVIRTLLPTLAASPLDAFAGALAAAMPYMNVSDARRSAGRRRELYAPLWALYLGRPEQSQADFARAAEQHVKKAGHTDLVLTERTPFGPNPFSFAGLTRINGDTAAACTAFTRGCRILDTAILSGARNQKTIDKAVGEMDDLWRQSHHVRAIGTHLVDLAHQAGILSEVTRTMTLEAAGLENTIVVTA
jgi:hypothetical protein